MKNEIKIHCSYDELLPPKDLKNHPKNRNKHGQDQIDRLAKLYEYHGIRHPIIISKLSGYIVAGHGRKLSAIRAGIKKVPVVFQDFESIEAEYAFLQSDNAIALWAELDLSGINEDLADLGPDFDLEMLGIRDFKLDFDPLEEWKEMPEFTQEDNMSFRRLIVHFDNQQDVNDFASLIDQKITDKTKFVWYPEKENLDTESKRYG